MWAWFEPRPGDYNPQAFEQFDQLIALAHKYQIYLHPTLLVGGEVGEAYWDVPWRMGRNPQSDPEMLRLETNHAQEFGAPLCARDGNPGLGSDRRAAFLDCARHQRCDGG